MPPTNSNRAARTSSTTSDSVKRASAIGGAIAGGLALARSPARPASGSVVLPFQNGERELVAYPQKRELMLVTARPMQLETPFPVFNNGLLTPNDMFFVRWHHTGVPTAIDSSAFSLRVRGLVRTPLSLTLDDVKEQFDTAEVTAVCECSGNSRGFFKPRVPGGQWGNGAMGNAVWKGARLKDVLAKAGLKASAVQVRFSGLDQPAEAEEPSFKKSLDLDVANRDDILLAYAMNGEPLPLLNGFPLRLVVPGYFGTYWVKMLNDIEVLDHVDDNFWMSTAYRVPADPWGSQTPGTEVPTVPISRLTIRSFITSLNDGEQVRVGQRYTVRGIAFDSGYGISEVLFSSDGGGRWTRAQLGPDLGKYSFRSWSALFLPSARQRYPLQSLAINAIGETQRATPIWNASGYLRNSIETVNVDAV